MVKNNNKNNSSNSLVFGRWPQTKISTMPAKEKLLPLEFTIVQTVFRFNFSQSAIQPASKTSFTMRSTDPVNVLCCLKIYLIQDHLQHFPRVTRNQCHFTNHTYLRLSTSSKVIKVELLTETSKSKKCCRNKDSNPPLGKFNHLSGPCGILHLSGHNLPRTEVP